jgi:hypothetical protein
MLPESELAGNLEIRGSYAYMLRRRSHIPQAAFQTSNRILQTLI